MRPAGVADDGSELTRRLDDALEHGVEFGFEAGDHVRRLGAVPIAGPAACLTTIR
jgi:hypothetical protein